jgi:hypothetical protein
LDYLDWAICCLIAIKYIDVLLCLTGEQGGSSKYVCACYVVELDVDGDFGAAADFLK